MSNGFIAYQNLVQHLRMNGQYRVNVTHMNRWNVNIHLWNMIQHMAVRDLDLKPMLRAETHPDYIDITL